VEDRVIVHTRGCFALKRRKIGARLVYITLVVTDEQTRWAIVVGFDDNILTGVGSRGSFGRSLLRFVFIAVDVFIKYAR